MSPMETSEDDIVSTWSGISYDVQMPYITEEPDRATTLQINVPRISVSPLGRALPNLQHVVVTDNLIDIVERAQPNLQHDVAADSHNDGAERAPSNLQYAVTTADQNVNGGRALPMLLHAVATASQCDIVAPSTAGCNHSIVANLQAITGVCSVSRHCPCRTPDQASTPK